MVATIAQFLTFEDGKTFVRIEYVGFEVLGPRWLAIQFGHRSGKAKPIQHFLLAGVFDF